MASPVHPALSAWNNVSVLVTGHTGFKGSWLSLWLHRLGARVTGFALPPPTNPALFDLAQLAGVMTDVRGDVRDLNAVVAAMEKASPTVVFHMAAQPLVRASYREPVETYATNVMGTVHVLEAARRVKTVKAVVVVTTDKTYANREWVYGYRETDTLGGHDPYSNSKACSELVTQAYRDAFFRDEARVMVGSARAGNVIGGGDWAEDRLLPDAARALTSGKPVVIRSPNAVRPWQHVLDPLCGYMTLAQALLKNGAAAARAYNFGPDPNDAWPVGRVMDAVCSQWGGGARWDRDVGAHPHETHALQLDSALARRELGWKPALPTAEGLQWTVSFYRDHHQGKGARALMESNLDAYQERLS